MQVAIGLAFQLASNLPFHLTTNNGVEESLALPASFTSTRHLLPAWLIVKSCFFKSTAGTPAFSSGRAVITTRNVDCSLDFTVRSSVVILPFVADPSDSCDLILGSYTDGNITRTHSLTPSRVISNSFLPVCFA